MKKTKIKFTDKWITATLGESILVIYNKKSKNAYISEENYDLIVKNYDFGNYEIKNKIKFDLTPKNIYELIEIYEKGDSNENFNETLEAKLRNHLSPFFNLAYMVLNEYDSKEMIEIIMDEAKVCKKYKPDILNLINKIKK